MEQQVTEIDSHFLKRLVSILSIGLIEGIRRDVITIDEAENLLFAPRTVVALSRLKATNDVVELIRIAMELGDIKRHVPWEFKNVLDDVVERSLETLKTSPPTNGQLDFWMNAFVR